MEKTFIKNTNVIIIGSEMAFNSDFTMEEKATYYILSCLPEDWNITIQGVMTLTGFGRNKVSAILQKLREYGYLETKKKGDGKFISTLNMTSKKKFEKNEYNNSMSSDKKIGNNQNEEKETLKADDVVIKTTSENMDIKTEENIINKSEVIPNKTDAILNEKLSEQELDDKLNEIKNREQGREQGIPDLSRTLPKNSEKPSVPHPEEEKEVGNRVEESRKKDEEDKVKIEKENFKEQDFKTKGDDVKVSATLAKLLGK